MTIQKWFWNVLISLDQLLNTLLSGDPDETLSSRAAKAKMRNHRWGCILCKILDWFDKDHCEKNIEHDEGKRVIIQKKDQ